MTVAELADRFAAGQVRALAQSISIVERGDPRTRELLSTLAAAGPRIAPTVGFTGAPGAGKSTLVDTMIRSARERKARVGVLAVDPSSPFSGGALLGDRLRMDRHLLDSGVYVRSMGARGHVGGLSPTAAEVVWLLGAFGFDEVLVETVGTGQSELEIPTIVDTTVVVLTPGMGDEIQLEKAGMMEIADVYAVNKADLPGAERLARQLRTTLNMGPRPAWRPPIVLTIANRAHPSADELWAAVEAHRVYLATTEAGRASTAARLLAQVADAVGERTRAWAREQVAGDTGIVEELLRDRLPNLVAGRLVDEAWSGGDVPRDGTMFVHGGTRAPAAAQVSEPVRAREGGP